MKAEDWAFWTYSRTDMVKICCSLSSRSSPYALDSFLCRAICSTGGVAHAYNDDMSQAHKHMAITDSWYTKTEVGSSDFSRSLPQSCTAAVASSSQAY